VRGLLCDATEGEAGVMVRWECGQGLWGCMCGYLVLGMLGDGREHQ